MKQRQKDPALFGMLAARFIRRQVTILSFLLMLASCSQRPFISYDPYKADNHAILQSQLSDSLYQATEGRRLSRKNRSLKTKTAAFELAKPAFLEAVGDTEDISGRRYAVDLVNGFWIVKGILPDGYTGGTLVAIMDAASGERLFTLIWK